SVVGSPRSGVAVTLKCFTPTDEVSMGAPFGTVPTQDAMPAGPEHEYPAGTVCPSAKVPPSSGRSIEIVDSGAVPVNEVTRFPLSVIQPVLPAASSATKPTSIFGALTGVVTRHAFGTPETGCRSANCQGPP